MTTRPPSRGRPRDTERTEAILGATNRLLAHVGYDALRVQDVATEAGCGLATIYRRWSTKEDLVAAAMKRSDDLHIDLTGNAEADLRRLVRHHAAIMGGGDMITGFLAAARAHPVLFDALQDLVADAHATLRSQLVDILGAANPHIDLIVDMVLGVLVFRAGVTDVDIDPDAYADEILRLVLDLA